MAHAHHEPAAGNLGKLVRDMQRVSRATLFLEALNGLRNSEVVLCNLHPLPPCSRLSEPTSPAAILRRRTSPAPAESARLNGGYRPHALCVWIRRSLRSFAHCSNFALVNRSSLRDTRLDT